MIDEVVDCLRSRWIGTGPRTRLFQERLRELTGAAHVVAVSSCTAALHLGLLCAGVGPGDEVVTSTLTFPATVNAILSVGATPVFVDVDPLTQNMTTESATEALSSRTKAIMPVHMHGRPCDPAGFKALARKYRLAVIEDAAHALGATSGGTPIGGDSDAACFSFYATKNFTSGEGGALATANADWADRVEHMSLHGLSRGAWQRYSNEGPADYVAVDFGFKYNMSDIHAALGLRQLDHFDEWQSRRAEIWGRYNDAFRDLPLGLPGPTVTGDVHANHLYSLLVPDSPRGEYRAGFRKSLDAAQIGTGVHFIAVHLHPYFEERLGKAEGRFPVAERISRQTVSIPLSPGMTDDDVDDVIDAVADACRSFL
jgi:dTDP-4-amino-4,6-dideoxygalactose transaminase